MSIKTTIDTKKQDLRLAVLLLVALSFSFYLLFSQPTKNPSPITNSESITIWLKGDRVAPGLYQLPAATTFRQLYILSNIALPTKNKNSILNNLLPPDTTITIRERELPIVGPIPAANTPVLFLPLPINRASRETLCTIKGVGPKLAQRIIDFREKEGRVERLEDLAQVKGIGPKKLEQIMPHLRVD